ncbi:MAG: FtsQ-type POTRA domain-containing protein [Hamadaea sp.]|nr:FtsQ-type POTRA domain-containing protein [Hamadaea sp.]NUR48988.1 FtsQ-type POTRA domain-containing protein [Hamadaea sp.]NUT07798.1 FtsQ-type POTRA domain-containing protein [Hamadaea sp.]
MSQTPDGPRRWRLVRASRDAVPASVRRFMARARRRRLRAAAPWGIGGVIVVLAGALVWLALQTSVLGVDLIRVTGVQVLSSDEVRAAAEVPKGTPLARVDTKSVARRIARLAPVESVDIGRSWPNTLTIKVVERTPVAVVPQDKKFAVVDRFGVVFLTVDDRPGDLPEMKLAQPGPDNPETKAGLQVLSDLTPQLKSELVRVVVDAPARIRLELRKGRTIVWGDATQGEVKARVATALLTRSGTQIDVSAPEVVTIS